MDITPVVFSYGSHPSQRADLYVPADGTVGPLPVVVLIHGGYWRTPFDRGLMAELADDLVARGYAVWNMDYRRVGDDDADYPATFEDAAAAVEKLIDIAPEHGVDPARAAFVGHSAGGHLALWLAAGFAPVAVVSQAGVADLIEASRDRFGLGSEKEGLGILDVPASDELLGGAWHEVPERYAYASPAELIGVYDGATLVVHGDADDRVPVGHSRRYVEAVRAADGGEIEFVEFPGTGHFEVLDPRHASWTITVQFLDRQLGNTSPG